MKRHLPCAEKATSISNLTKYCACQEISFSWLIHVTYETSFTLCGAGKVTLQIQHVRRLPRTCQFKIWARNPGIASANDNFEDDPAIIRQWNRHLAPAASETLLVRSWKRFCIEEKCHEMLRLSRKMAVTFSKYFAKLTLHLPHLLRLPRKCYSLLYSTHLFSLGTYLLAFILSSHLFSLGTYSLLASFLCWHLSFLGIYSLLLASSVSWHLVSLGIYSLVASILSWHLFSLGIFSLLASFLSWHLFCLGIFSVLASILFSWHLVFLGI